MTRIILASQSPRRKQLLEAMGVEFETIPSNFDEYLDDGRDPELVAKELALGKALDVAERYSEALVIGSDTIVTVDGHQLGKPANDSEARAMLVSLAGKPNYVTTGVAIVSIAGNVRVTGANTAAVYFKALDAQMVEDYVATGDPFDKAGGYAVQHPLCKPMIEKIQGNQDTIIGFPTALVASLLADCGVSANQIPADTLHTILK